MKYKTFNYKNHNNCYFNVGSYNINKQAMLITIVNKDEKNIIVTVNMDNYLYEPNIATIKNYDANKGMTEFLQQLGIIKDVLVKRLIPPNYSTDETVDYCIIDMNKLKEYTNQFNYKWEI